MFADNDFGSAVFHRIIIAPISYYNPISHGRGMYFIPEKKKQTFISLPTPNLIRTSVAK